MNEVTDRMNYRQSFWRDRPVFVTGATGLVGGWIVKELLRHEADVVCLVRDWVPDSEFIRSETSNKLKVVRGNLCDPGLIERILGEYEIQTVFHLAAQTIVGIANQAPLSTFETNVRGTWLLLEACRASSYIQQVILASSDKAYGDHGKAVYTEDMPLQGKHPYDASKSCADLIAQTYANTYGLPVVVTRCANIYGGGDLNWNRLIPGTIRSVHRNIQPVIRSDGTQVRDYLYVEDATEFYLLVAEMLSQKPELLGHSFNVTADSGISVLELVEMILHLMNSDLKPDVRNEARHEIPYQRLDMEKAKSVLNWHPSFSLKDGLNHTIKWYEQFFAQTKP